MEKNIQTISGRQLVDIVINRLLDIPVPARYKETIADPIVAVVHDLTVFAQVMDQAQIAAKNQIEEAEEEPEQVDEISDSEELPAE